MDLDGSVEVLAEVELLKLFKAQRRLLKRAPPAVPGYQLAVSYRPSYIATGDYYDFFPADGGAAIFVGDGSGHGPTASMLMATMRAILLTHPELHGEPGPTLTAINRMYHAVTASDMFMTGLYLRLGAGGWICWASAGNDPPLRLGPSGAVLPSDLSTVGMPLGVEPDESYATVHWRLGPGERLLIFTDGIVESRSRMGERFGRHGLKDCLSDLIDRPLKDLLEETVARAAAFLTGADFEDDFTLVGVERSG